MSNSCSTSSPGGLSKKNNNLFNFNCAIFIGRFQPFHKGHLEIALEGRKLSDRLLMFLGSVQESRTLKNPWTFDERRDIIQSYFPEDDNNIWYYGVRDYNNDQEWADHIRLIVRSACGNSPSAVLLGNHKDESSYYLDLFPEWAYREVKTTTNINAQDIRDELFKPKWTQYVNNDTKRYLRKFIGRRAFDETLANG